MTRSITIYPSDCGINLRYLPVDLFVPIWHTSRDMRFIITGYNIEWL